jgi:hypothetical protein
MVATARLNMCRKVLNKEKIERREVVKIPLQHLLLFDAKRHQPLLEEVVSAQAETASAAEAAGTEIAPRAIVNRVWGEAIPLHQDAKNVVRDTSESVDGFVCGGNHKAACCSQKAIAKRTIAKSSDSDSEAETQNRSQGRSREPRGTQSDTEVTYVRETRKE